MAETVLITTHDLAAAGELRSVFARDGFAVELLTAGERIGDVDEPVLLVLTGGLEEKRSRRLIREAYELDRLPVIGLSAGNEIPPGETPQRYGMAAVFLKPVDAAEVGLAGRRFVERRRLVAATGIIGETEAMQEALERVLQIAPTHATVLITGESGTGKELVARGIHALSARRHKAFIAANMAALPETLLESELFGHEKGAFTGAVAQRKGLFELAHKGTLFLDEIGEMPLVTQTKLLRVLEERQFMRVGGEEPIHVDVRVIAATNQDLRHNVEVGEFRRDLYYRLNVLTIHLPPLRERREDIPVLIDAFTRAASQEHDRSKVVISPDAMAILVDYAWPGNIRELRNLVESMVVLAPGRVITAEDIPPGIRGGHAGRNLLPVPVARRERAGGGGERPQPELEFVFRTLLQLRMDVEELRQQFDEYRRRNPEFPGPARLPYPYPFIPGQFAVAPPAAIDAVISDAANGDAEPEQGETVVVFRNGMTMQDIEREAILAALKKVAGNRRKAAENLGIGERTLYRKIKEYGIPL
jgi:DNA-binding NtrC family response regulator